MIRILIADDEVLLLEAISTILELEEDFEVVAQVQDGYSALKLSQELDPDIILLDLEMPIMDGVTAAQQILAQGPAKIIILTAQGRPAILKRALTTGVKGFVTKITRSKFLTQIIREVYAGGSYIDPALVSSALSESECPLNSRELEIFALMKAGKTDEEISKTLFISVGTLRNNISAASKKIHTKNRQEALQKAWQEGWI